MNSIIIINRQASSPLKLQLFLTCLRAGERCLSVSVANNGLSDPFKHKKSDFNKDVQEYLKEKKDLSKHKYDDQLPLKDNLIGRIFKSVANPKPLNTKFRERFNLNDNYRLVYVIENERLTLISNVIASLAMPIFIAIIVIISLAEATGSSQLSKSFENPHLFLGAFSVWFFGVYFILNRSKNATVFRIYKNIKDDTFVMLRLKGVLKFVREDFTKKDFLLKSNAIGASSQKTQSNVLKNMSGNVKINGKNRQVDFKLFSSDEILENLIGKENFLKLRRYT